MTVHMNAGAGFVDGALFLAGEANSPGMTELATGETYRKDTVSVNPTTGALHIEEGTVDTATAPDPPGDNMKLAEVYHRFGESGIYDTDTTGEGYITDFRNQLSFT